MHFIVSVCCVALRPLAYVYILFEYLVLTDWWVLCWQQREAREQKERPPSEGLEGAIVKKKAWQFMLKAKKSGLKQQPSEEQVSTQAEEEQEPADTDTLQEEQSEATSSWPPAQEEDDDSGEIV